MEMLSHLPQERKEVTLAQTARKLVMDLEPKITEVELIQDRQKKPLEQQALKALSRTDTRLKILLNVSR